MVPIVNREESVDYIIPRIVTNLIIRITTYVKTDITPRDEREKEGKIQINVTLPLESRNYVDSA